MNNTCDETPLLAEDAPSIHLVLLDPLYRVMTSSTLLREDSDSNHSRPIFGDFRSELLDTICTPNVHATDRSNIQKNTFKPQLNPSGSSLWGSVVGERLGGGSWGASITNPDFPTATNLSERGVSTHAFIFQLLCVWPGWGPVSVGAFFFFFLSFFLSSFFILSSRISLQCAFR